MKYFWQYFQKRVVQRVERSVHHTELKDSIIVIAVIFFAIVEVMTDDDKDNSRQIKEVFREHGDELKGTIDALYDSLIA